MVWKRKLQETMISLKLTGKILKNFSKNTPNIKNKSKPCNRIFTKVSNSSVKILQYDKNNVNNPSLDK